MTVQSKELSWRDPIIRDGLSQRGYIAEEPGLHGELRFTFRPFLPEKVEELEAMRDRDGLREPAKVRIKLGQELARRIVSWSAQDAVTEENVRRLRMAQQAKMYRIVCGLMASDPDPDDASGLSDAEPLMETLGN